jgi:hypothetical protein
MAITTPTEVFDLLGVEVTPAEIAKAQFIIEMESGTVEDAITAGNVSGRNERYLVRATAAQAVWMLDHPDVFSAMDVTSFNQDGVSGQFRGDWAQYLAPIAKRYLDRLTWKTAPLRVQRRRSRWAETDLGNRNSAAYDDSKPWMPL